MLNKLMWASNWAGFLAISSYAMFATAAYVQYPGAFTPATHWLSDLGDIRQNPSGAWVYNLGIILTGVFVFLFFLSRRSWKMGSHRVQNTMVLVTQIFGCLGSLCLILSAVYPISQIEQHRFWSISMYILLGTGFAFSVAALRYQPNYPAVVLALGATTAGVDIFSGIFSQVTFLEWITVALFLIYLLVLSVITSI